MRIAQSRSVKMLNIKGKRDVKKVQKLDAFTRLLHRSGTVNSSRKLHCQVRAVMKFWMETILCEDFEVKVPKKANPRNVLCHVQRSRYSNNFMFLGIQSHSPIVTFPTVTFPL